MTQFRIKRVERTITILTDCLAHAKKRLAEIKKKRDTTLVKMTKLSNLLAQRIMNDIKKNKNKNKIKFSIFLNLLFS